MSSHSTTCTCLTCCTVLICLTESPPQIHYYTSHHLSHPPTHPPTGITQLTNHLSALVRDGVPPLPPSQPRIVGAASMHNMTHAFSHQPPPAAKRPKT